MPGLYLDPDANKEIIKLKIKTWLYIWMLGIYIEKFLLTLSYNNDIVIMFKERAFIF